MTKAILSKKRSPPHRIDIHHHIVPSFYVSILESIGVTGCPGFPFPKWTPQRALDVMNRHGIATAITSISTPGVYFQDPFFSRDLARRCNEYAARLAGDHPDRFGAFASLPLPDVEGALQELEYAIDTLGLDGVVLLSNVEGHYLGDPKYKELFAELDRQRTTVFIHPNDPPGDRKLVHLYPITEWCLDTTRAVVNLMYSGTLQRYPNIRFILSHAGGTVPFLAWRIALGRYKEANNIAYDKAMYDFTMGNKNLQKSINILKQLYYDTTSSTTPYALRSLQELVDPSHILFGSDYVWAPSLVIPALIRGLKSHDGFDEQALSAVERESALELFPRFKEH